MSDNMNDKNENLDETVVDETAETASNETVDDVATDDIAADASSADSIESIDFAVVYDDDNADIEIAASDGAEISDDVNDGDTAVAADGDAVVSADNADTTEVADDAATAADTADGSNVVANNANQVKETLALRSSDEPTVLESHEMVKADSATSVSSQLDREIKHHRKKDAFFFKANPTFALDHVTVINRKTGRNILDDLSLSFHACGARGRGGSRTASGVAGHHGRHGTHGPRQRDAQKHQPERRRTGRNVGTPHRIHSATFRFPPRSRRGKQCTVRHGCVEPQLPQAEACDRPRTAQARGLRRSDVRPGSRRSKRTEPAPRGHRSCAELRG